jgi:hypothetical protein
MPAEDLCPEQVHGLKTALLRYLEHGFEQELLEAAFGNLADCNNKLKYNNFAYSVRELTRHVLHRLAPDEKVVLCSWYAKLPEIDISRFQRALYAIKGGLDDGFVGSTLGIDVDSISKRLVDIIGRLSKYTHIEPKTFDINTIEGQSLVIEVLQSSTAFFDAIADIRADLVEKYEDLISDQVLDALTAETVGELDELATHYWIEEVCVDDISVDSISDACILIDICGSVSVQHQHGSDSDAMRDMGYEFNKSYPLHAALEVPIDDPLRIIIELEDIDIDTSSCWDEGE